MSEASRIEFTEFSAKYKFCWLCVMFVTEIGCGFCEGFIIGWGFVVFVGSE